MSTIAGSALKRTLNVKNTADVKAEAAFQALLVRSFASSVQPTLAREAATT